MLDSVSKALQKVSNDLKRYLEARIGLLQIDITEQLSELVSAATIYLFAGIFGFIGLLFFFYAISSFLTTLFGSAFIANTIVAFINFIILFTIIKSPNRIKTKVKDAIQKAMLKSQDDVKLIDDLTKKSNSQEFNIEDKTHTKEE